MKAVRDRSAGSACRADGAIGAAHDIEGAGPVVVRHLRRLVPVVDGLVDEQHGLPAGSEVHERIRGIGERRPYLERRLDAKWQVMVVEEQQRRRSGVHQQAVVARALQGSGAAFLHDLEVRGEKAGPGVHVLSNGG